MKIVKSLDQYSHLLDVAKRKNRLSMSNCLFMKQDIIDLTASQTLFYKNIPSGILLIRKHRGRNYLYYFLDETKEFCLDGIDEVLMIEIIDRLNLNRSAKQVDFWERNGFCKYGTNLEMVKANKDTGRLEPLQEETFIIKFASIDYADQILDLWRDSLDELIMPLPTKQELIRMIIEGWVVCVLNDKHRIIGALHVEDTYGRCLLSHVVIHPNYRGIGLGTRMICYCISQARAQKFYLWVNQDNQVAQRLYTNLGFEYSQKISIQLINNLEVL